MRLFHASRWIHASLLFLLLAELRDLQNSKDPRILCACVRKSIVFFEPLDSQTAPLKYFFFLKKHDPVDIVRVVNMRSTAGYAACLHSTRDDLMLYVHMY